jgi:hypothetical protein
MPKDRRERWGGETAGSPIRYLGAVNKFSNSVLTFLFDIYSVCICLILAVAEEK